MEKAAVARQWTGMQQLSSHESEVEWASAKGQGLAFLWSLPFCKGGKGKRILMDPRDWSQLLRHYKLKLLV